MTSKIRVPLTVEVVFHEGGAMDLKSVIFDDTKYEIQKTLGMRKFYPEIGVAPTEYSVYVEGQVKKIYFEPSTNKWFSVKIVHC